MQKSQFVYTYGTGIPHSQLCTAQIAERDKARDVDGGGSDDGNGKILNRNPGKTNKNCHVHNFIAEINIK